MPAHDGPCLAVTRDWPALVGVSTLFRQVLSVADTVAGNDCIVLLEGESGTGKELIARRIHLRSRRQPGAFRTGQLSRHQRDAFRKSVLRPPQGGIHRGRQ